MYDLEERLIDFSVQVIDIVEALPHTRAGNHIAGQLIRSGTSPAPNHAEARGAESRSDFIHKMRLGLKELRETRVWLLLILNKGLVASVEWLRPAVDECNQLISIFVASIRTAEKNRNRSHRRDDG